MLNRVDYDLVGRFSCEMLSHESLEERFSLFEAQVLRLGFEGATYTYIPNLGKDAALKLAPIFAYTRDYPLVFLEEYQAERFDQNDFTIQKIRAGCKDVLDWSEYRRMRALTHRQVKIVMTAREHGIQQGLTIPTLSGQRGIAGASIISSEKDASFQLLKEERLGTLAAITRIFHIHTYADKQYVQQLLRHFNDKEKAILKYLAQGGDFSRIEYAIDVASYKVATQMLKKIRGKFGDVSRDRLMFLVGLLSLVDDE